MNSSKTRWSALFALVVAAALIGACGEQDSGAPTQPAGPALAPASAIDADPYAIACGHVRDQQKWADTTRRATVAIAERERFEDLNRLRASQSLYYAMTEVCKREPATFEPARAAADGVRDGTLRVSPPDRDSG